MLVFDSGTTHHNTYVQLTVIPETGYKFKQVEFSVNKESEFQPKRLRRQVFEAINNGVKSAFSRGIRIIQVKEI